jgi:hypothetical protein
MTKALAGFYFEIFIDDEISIIDLNNNEIFNTFVAFKLI